MSIYQQVQKCSACRQAIVHDGLLWLSVLDGNPHCKAGYGGHEIDVNAAIDKAVTNVQKEQQYPGLPYHPA